MRQLDAGANYREQIERELQKRLEAKKDDPSPARGKAPRAGVACSACNTMNDADAKFCKSCGQSLAGI
jgi:hypothetical protein